MRQLFKQPAAHSGIPNLEKLKVVDQIEADRRAGVKAHVFAHPGLFTRPRALAAGWRHRRTRRFGPYSRWVFRDRGRRPRV
jgi:hypothetical protein